MRIQHVGWKISLITFFVLASMVGLALAFSSGPPIAVTGDFNEATCRGCHTTNPLNVAGGTFKITGVPAQYTPGTTYPITVTLSKSGQVRWGFELAVRIVTSGDQAGTLVVTDSQKTQIKNSTVGIQYIQQTTAGTSQGASQGSWTFNWVAPSAAVGAIRFSAAGNAANGNGNNQGDFIYTTTETTTPLVVTANPITALFSHVAVGGGYTTQFTLSNTGSNAVTGTLILTKSDGTPLNVTLASPSAASDAPTGIEQVLASSTAVSIPPGGIQFVSASPNSASDPLAAGWARVESSGGTLGGVATFQLRTGGSLSTIAGVLAAETEDSATIPVDDDGSQNRFTGYAVANPGTDSIRIRIVVVNADGTIAQSLSPTELNPLAPGKQIAKFVWQDLNNANLKFRGSIVLASEGGKKFGVVALVQNQGLFTAIPVLKGKAPGI